VGEPGVTVELIRELRVRGAEFVTELDKEAIVIDDKGEPVNPVFVVVYVGLPGVTVAVLRGDIVGVDAAEDDIEAIGDALVAAVADLLWVCVRLGV